MFLRYLPLSNTRGRLKKVTILATLAVLIILRSIELLQSLMNIRPSIPNDEQPHYLHRSKFRTNPDMEYESHLSSAMRIIERKEQYIYGDDEASDILWQMLLEDKLTHENRGQDSLLMEERNAEWIYKVSMTSNAEANFGSLATLYHSYPHFVQRSDLLRYLILWYFGGYYADMDVIPSRSIKDCPAIQESTERNNSDISLILGIEIDEPFASSQEMKFWHWVRRYGFAQYTMYAARRFSPLLREVIVRVISHTNRHLDESNIFLGPQYNEMTTLELTGPGVFTDAILDVLSDSLPDFHPLVTKSINADIGIGDLDSPKQRVSWAPFHRLQQPFCVEGSETRSGKDFGGLCILPVNVWANGQRHSNSRFQYC
ncbi:uncharacterized protein N7483_006416 [Penicillium malachiteum]|uniref:uncharacterized protein n=1 Tax=Penicillium malachiteum TaxID=1324776 RepID=UPI0025467DA4|nr:uncharacterized protein N7483_006416 [Penicillium malachiteum]KAJ5725059.1 hypothetical protein N7483_006416 [Penicillium malachiteum]